MGIDQSKENAARLSAMAKQMRRMALDMTLSAGPKGAHVGGGFSCMEIMAVLYGEVLRLDHKNPLDPQRDRFLASKNHCTLAHFPALVEAGYLKEEELCTFSRDGSRLIGYPYDPRIGLEYSGGSLGMAISFGIGQALAAKWKEQPQRVYVLMGDGELNEGSIWEAFMSAAQYRLDNLTAIIDRNHLSYDGNTEDIMGLDDISAKLKAFNWHVETCNGHDIADLLRAFGKKEKGRPTAIIAETVKGKGLPFAEGRPEWHQKAMTEEQYRQALAEIGGEV